MDQIPDACLLPVTHQMPARHPRSAPEFLREHLSWDATAMDEDNAGQTRAIRDARPSAFWSAWWGWQKRFDKIPQRIWKQHGGHVCSRYLADEDQVSEVLLHALTKSRQQLLGTEIWGHIRQETQSTAADLMSVRPIVRREFW